MTSNFVLENRPEIHFLNPSGTSLKVCFSRPSINIQRHLSYSELVSIQYLAHWLTMNLTLSPENAQQFTFESLQYKKPIWAVTALRGRQWLTWSIYSTLKIISFQSVSQWITRRGILSSTNVRHFIFASLQNRQYICAVTVFRGLWKITSRISFTKYSSEFSW